MSASIHQSTVPAVVAAYFGCFQNPDIDVHPIVAETYIPGRGWKRLGYRKRVSYSFLRKLRRDGVTVVALRQGRRLADFGITEALR